MDAPPTMTTSATAYREKKNRKGLSESAATDSDTALDMPLIRDGRADAIFRAV